MKQRFLIVSLLLLSISFAWADDPRRHVITYTDAEINANPNQYWKSFSPSFPVTIPQLGAEGNPDNIGVYVGQYYDTPAPTLVMTLINGSSSVKITAAYGVLIKSTSVGSITLPETDQGPYYDGTNYLNGTGAEGKDPVTIKGGDTYLMVLHKTLQHFVSYEGDDNVPANKAYFTWTPPAPETPAPSINIVEESEVVTALANCEEETVVTKIVRDGQLFIVRDGVTYDIMGRSLR